MAVVSNPRDFAAPEVKIGCKTAFIAFYLLIGVIAAAIAIPAAFMTQDVGLFEECFAAAEVCAAH